MTAPVGVAFDLDGTLLDTMTVAPQAYVDTIRTLGGPSLTTDDITTVWHIGPTTVVLEHFLRRKLIRGDLDRFHATFDAAVSAVKPFDGISAMLQALRRDGYVLGIYTTATRRAATAMLTTTGLARHLGALVGGDEVTRPKPAPDGLLQLADQLGTTPDRVAYVGDSVVDTQCAHAARSLPILAAWSAPATQPDPGAHTAATPHDVVEILRAAAVHPPAEVRRPLDNQRPRLSG